MILGEEEEEEEDEERGRLGGEGERGRLGDFLMGFKQLEIRRIHCCLSRPLAFPPNPINAIGRAFWRRGEGDEEETRRF
ncbi:MAG: hypothetical protein VKL42_14525 [Snowella sp.]|nr:hypothetical protein [Snowella sp.]